LDYAWQVSFFNGLILMKKETNWHGAIYDYTNRVQGKQMARMRRSNLTVILLLLVWCHTYASFFDNRFFPPFERPYVTVDQRPSHWALDLFASTSKKAFGVNGKEIGIPELFGELDQAQWAQSFVLAGCPNPLPTEWQMAEIPWTMEGYIQAQGIVPSYQQQITRHFSVGFYGLIMQVQSRYEFFLGFQQSNLMLTPAERLQLGEIRRSMSQAIGLCSDSKHQSGLGDLDIYARFGDIWQYMAKMRRIEAGIRFGLLIPFGQRNKLDYPSSIPFGGNHQWGVYVMGDAEFEIKEDWKLGAWLRASKRFERIETWRMPVGQEPQFLGLVIGRALVDPGVTIMFSPYFSMENLREGLGARVQYTLMYHDYDEWCDARQDKIVPTNLKEVIRLSQWTAEYITLTVFYDFGKVKVERGFDPIVRLAWDVPQVLIATRDVPKTHKISLGIEFNF